MQNKRLILITISVVFVLSMVVIGCRQGKSPKSLSEKVQEQLTGMKSYQCTADLIYIQEDKENIYHTKQIYDMAGKYRMEMMAPEHVKGLVTIFDGQKVLQYNPRVQDQMMLEVKESKYRNQVFLGMFLKNYLQSEDVAMEVMNIEGGKCTILDAVIPGANTYMVKERLWIDNETLKPVRMVIYTKEDKESIIIEYSDFEYDPKITDQMFKMQG